MSLILHFACGTLIYYMVKLITVIYTIEYRVLFTSILCLIQMLITTTMSKTRMKRQFV